ncbi:MAG TPA: TlpA disulfide reductase family protein [Pyrinomonadaceae bacterium]|jgi:thiol-disulfide isomerase/thioredoxin|nr:TlpA disulfide reductase family protein [Pyrinomonadaceae bacterium]
MKKTFPLLLFAALAAHAAAQSGRRITPPPPPAEPQAEAPSTEAAPATTRAPSTNAEFTTLPESVLKRELQSLDRGSFRLSDFGGKILVVNLWATWCGPCRAEIPEYERVRKDYAARGVEFVGLTTEDPRTSAERVRQFLREVKFGFRLAWADRETALALMNGRNSIPQTYVIAADGTIVRHWRGYASGGRSSAMLRDALERALSGAARDADAR